MNTSLRRNGLAVVASLLAAAGCEKAEPQLDLDTIVARHTEARGGAAALEAVSALEVRRRVEERKQQFTTHYIATRDGRMRLDVYDDDRRVFSAGNDGESAWQQAGSLAEAEEMPEWALTAVRRALRHNLYALHEQVASGTRLELKEREKTAGLLHWVIDATDPDGYRQRLHIHPYSYLISRIQEFAPVNPERTTVATDLDTYYLEFQTVDGVLFSFKSETRSSDSGEPVQVTEALEIKVNPELDESVFARPSDDEGDRR